MSRHAATLVDLLRSKRQPSAKLWAAEIGVWRGDVSRALLEQLQDLTLLMVDSWREFPLGHAYRESADSMSRLTQDDYDAARNLATKATADFADRRLVIHGSSELAASLVQERSLDLVFIDAEHSFAALSADISFWWPKVRAGGTMSGHDWGVYPEVEQAVNEWVRSQRGLALQHGRGAVWYVERPV